MTRVTSLKTVQCGLLSPCCQLSSRCPHQIMTEILCPMSMPTFPQLFQQWEINAKWFSFPPIKNGLSYGDRPHRHHRAAPAPTEWQKREQLSKHPSHLDCLCLQRSWSRKLVAAKSRAAFVSLSLCLTHSCPLSRSNGQSSFTRATTLSPSIPPASRAPLSNIYNED